MIPGMDNEALMVYMATWQGRNEYQAGGSGSVDTFLHIECPDALLL